MTEKDLQDYLANNNLDDYDSDQLIAMFYLTECNMGQMAEYIGCPEGKIWSRIKNDINLLEAFGHALEYAKYGIYTEAVEGLQDIMAIRGDAPNPAINGIKFAIQTYSPLYGVNMKIKKGDAGTVSEFEIMSNLYSDGAQELMEDEDE